VTHTLSQSSRRAYLEARHPHVNGDASVDWQRRPGSCLDLEVWMNAFDVAAEEDVSP